LETGIGAKDGNQSTLMNCHTTTLRDQALEEVISGIVRGRKDFDEQCSSSHFRDRGEDVIVYSSVEVDLEPIDVKAGGLSRLRSDCSLQWQPAAITGG
jgi:hypothetical protein